MNHDSQWWRTVVVCHCVELKLQKDRGEGKAMCFSLFQKLGIFFFFFFKQGTATWQVMICAKAHAFGATKAPKCCPKLH